MLARMRVSARDATATRPAEMRVAIVSNDSGKLVAMCIIPLPSLSAANAPVSNSSTLDLDTYVEPVVDSSRYFVLRLERRDAGARAPSVGFVGVGFRDRQVAFDFRSALRDHVAFHARHANVTSAVLAPPVTVVTSSSDDAATDATHTSLRESATTSADARVTDATFSEFSLAPGQVIHVDVSTLRRAAARSRGVAAASSKTDQGSQSVDHALITSANGTPPEARKLRLAPPRSGAPCSTADAATTGSAAADVHTDCSSDARSSCMQADAARSHRNDDMDDFGDFAAAVPADGAASTA